MPVLPSALPFAFSGAVSPGLMVSGRVVLMGFSMAETAGAVAVWSIADATSGGIVTHRVSLNANESTREWFGPMGIAYEGGIVVTRTSGTVTGAIFYMPEERLADYGYSLVESTG